MFWSLGHFTSPSIDTILDREAGFTLEELLEEDELLQECKGQNTKLTDFLTQPETLDKLVRYVTDMPSADDTEARRYKYPFVASEVLACDIPVLRDAIFAAPSLLQQLLSLLQQPPPLAPVLAGYVVKVVTALQKQGPDAFTKFFEDANGISVDTLLPQLVKHIGSDSILQLLINLCVGEPPAAEPGGPQGLPSSREDLAAASWLPHDRLIPAVIDALGAEGDDGAESAANASALLCALLAASTEPPYCLEEPEGGAARCAALVRVCLGDDISGPPNLPAMEMVLQLLGKLRDSQSSSPVLSSLLDAVEVDVERFFAALAAPTPLPARIARFLPTDGLAYRPRGQQRCKLLLLMEECLKSERPALIQPLIELGLFHIVIDLLLLPHSCNALHMRASAILEWAVATTCEHASAIHQSLFVEATLAQRLLLLVAEYTPPPPPPPPADGDTQPPPPPPKRKTLPCCHAFVMHIGACLLSAAQREPDVRELLERVDGWDAFISPGGALTTWEALQSKPLGGLAPTRCDDESDDDDEIDATTMERVLAAQAAASRGDHSLDSNQDDEDDEEGGHSSEYLQHFAQYLSNRNFLNQTGQDHDFNNMPQASSDSWTAEFDDFDVEGSSGAPPSASSAVSNATGAIDGFDDFDEHGAAGGGTTAGGAGSLNLSSDQWAAEFESLSTSAAAADGGMDDGWAAFDPAPPTSPAANSDSAPSAEAPAADASDPS